jgi:hypothetical protein
MTVSMSETTVNGTTRIVESIKMETTDIESTKSVRPPAIDATSKNLPKCPAVFLPEDLREKMGPILRQLYDHEEGIWFRQPVTEAIAPGYFDIIKYPMDFSTIFKKLDEGQYTTPYQFYEDMWLVFENTWLFNKKTQKVYKAGLKVNQSISFSSEYQMNFYLDVRHVYGFSRSCDERFWLLLWTSLCIFTTWNVLLWC